MNCRNCGNQIINNSRFCAFCGNKITQEEQILSSLETNDILVVEPKFASKKRRLANYFLDIFFAYVFAFLLGILLAIVLPENLSESFFNMNDKFLGFIVFVIYYTLFESLFGKTVGKMITKTRVISESKNGASFPQIFARSLCRFIPFNAISIFFSNENQCWHDSISQTKVVLDR